MTNAQRAIQKSRAIVASTLTFMSAIAGGVVVRDLVGAWGATAAAVAGALSTGLLTAALLNRAYRTKYPALAGLCFAVGAGAANAPLTYLLFAPFSARHFDIEEILMLGGLFGANYGALFGATGAPLMAIGQWMEARPSRALVPQTLMVSSVWLAFTAWLLARSMTTDSAARAASLVLTMLAMSPALALWIGRSLWLRRVRQNKVDGYRVVPASLVDAPPGLLGWDPRSDAEQVLVEIGSSSSGAPYRGETPLRAIAYAGARAKRGQRAGFRPAGILARSE